MSEELIKRLRNAAHGNMHRDMPAPVVNHLLREAADALSRPAPAVQVPDDVIRRVSRIVIDCDTSDGKQTGGYLSVGDLRKIKAAIEPKPAQADRTTPYTGRDQELIDSLWSGIAPAVQVPEEWAAVPMMPTDAMMLAFDRIFSQPTNAYTRKALFCIAYADMLAAAPAPATVATDLIDHFDLGGK